MTRRSTLAIAGVALIALATGGGIAIAGGDSGERASGPEADRAAQAAQRSVGGRVVGVERDDGGGAGWEVELQRSDGRTVEVHLDRRLKQVGVEPDDDTAGGGDDD